MRPRKPKQHHGRRRSKSRHEFEVRSRSYPRASTSLLVLLSVALFSYFYFADLRDFISPDGGGGKLYPPFVVAELIGKGKGAVASRDIQQGECVIREKPLFVLPSQISSSPTALISQSLSRLTQTERDSFYNLSFVNFPEDLVPEDHPEQVALAIFQTNAVGAGTGVGLFPHTARLNHGCSRAFNVVYSWRETEGVLVVHALRNIKKGEELLTTYTNTKKTRTERREFLAQHYGFRCACDVCSLPEAKARLSDRRLTAIASLYAQLSKWSQAEIDGKQAIGIVNKIWELGEEEGYWSERGQLAADAAWIAAAHSDAPAASAWTQLAVKWYAHELGSDSREALGMEKTISRPRLHSAWGTREKMSVGMPSTAKRTGWKSWIPSSW